MSAFIGILSLDTRFPRIPGDAGHPDSYHLPARIRVVAGAGSPDIVRDGRPAPALVAAFIAAAQALEREGAVMLTSTCGFLITVQAEIAAAVRIPVVLSGLALVPLVRLMTGNRPVGILTASRPSLGTAALQAAGCTAEAVRIAGLEHEAAFAETFLTAKELQRQRLDPGEIEAAVTRAARGLVAAHPEIGALVLECGNLPPYAAAVRRAVGRPVFSILDAARLLDL
ncbi:aspartate/glutamate racemase family protein [Phaeovulum sp. W22_SRMD_FR3]|uniref:aspartate/glutamate racemase family protein n=1 Tax=Phaeovulum sp. W22_SRMD_FR3 TaxID=3240274 RepID=UPI003F9AEADF